PRGGLALAFLVRGGCLLLPFGTLRASPTFVGAFVAGGIFPTASRRNLCWRIPRIFVRIRLRAFVAGAWLPDPLRLGRRLHRLQLASRALLSHARRHAYLRQSDCRRSTWLAVR